MQYGPHLQLKSPLQLHCAALAKLLGTDFDLTSAHAHELGNIFTAISRVEPFPVHFGWLCFTFEVPFGVFEVPFGVEFLNSLYALFGCVTALLLL